ncbi:MAG: periplasmic heavy metal sensor [Chitinophagaceae bacterium]
MNSIKNNRWLSVISLLLVTANIVTLVLLWMHRPERDHGEQGPPPPTGQAVDFISKELKLDSAQQNAFQKMREEHRLAVRPIQDSIRLAKDAFFSLLQQPNLPDSILQLHNMKISDLEQQINLFTFRHFQKLRAICNAEQQKKFDSIIQEVIRGMGPQRRPGPPPMGPGREGEGPDRPDRRNMPPPPPEH